MQIVKRRLGGENEWHHPEVNWSTCSLMHNMLYFYGVHFNQIINAWHLTIKKLKWSFIWMSSMCFYCQSPSVRLLVTIQKRGMSIWMMWCLDSELKSKWPPNTHPITWCLAERLVIHPKSHKSTWYVFLSVTNYMKIPHKGPLEVFEARADQLQCMHA